MSCPNCEGVGLRPGGLSFGVAGAIGVCPNCLGALKNPLLLQGDVLERLAQLPPESVSCVVTSPPYWSLRKYDAPDVVWGGDPGCEHEWADVSKEGASVEGYAGKRKWQHSVDGSGALGNGTYDPQARRRADNPDDWTRITRDTATCSRCGAWRGQYGLEPTPELYVEHTLDVLRAIRRVLRPDGVVWWNIGDGYAANVGPGARDAERWPMQSRNDHVPASMPRTGPTLKPKDLILMPFRVALAAQADGWWVRSDIIWSKPNAMPESTRDRPTKAHEYVFMLTKNARYWWDQDAVREPQTGNAHARRIDGKRDGTGTKVDPAIRGTHAGWEDTYVDVPGGRNLRSVWEFPTAQTPEAHFATFPEELPRRCIEASCPREVCVACGHARERITSGTSEPARENYAGAGIVPVHRGGGDRAGGFYPERTTTGWTACDCESPQYQPGLVLDPFAGIGTTGVVALRLGRRFIGIELSEQYAAMAEAKMATWWRDTRLVEPERNEAQLGLPLE